MGIDRKIAYANKKYHSGLMWIGVIIGFAGEKLSGSIKMNGLDIDIIVNSVIIIENPIMSLIEKYGWNGILSIDEFSPIGLFEPVMWRNIRWIITIIVMMNGSVKWILKNRDSVALSTENPPQIQYTNVDPTYGIADTKLVITVAPQNDICPHGRTYPMNAVAIVKSRIITPTIHVFIIL